MSHPDYSRSIKATALYKLIPDNISCKFKFGRHLSNERFQRIIAHLEERGRVLDRETVEIMKKQRGEYNGV